MFPSCFWATDSYLGVQACLLPRTEIFQAARMAAGLVGSPADGTLPGLGNAAEALPISAFPPLSSVVSRLLCTWTCGRSRCVVVAEVTVWWLHHALGRFEGEQRQYEPGQLGIGSLCLFHNGFLLSVSPDLFPCCHNRNWYINF